MNDLELIQLYQDLTAAGEALARSVVMFVQPSPLTEPNDAVQPPATASDAGTPPMEGTEPPPGAED